MHSPEYQAGQTKIIGPVFTVKFAPMEDSTAPKLRGNYVRIRAHLKTTRMKTKDCKVDQIPKDSVVFISQPLPHINACYGGLMSLRAQILGAKGVVIDGYLRDLQEHRDLKFPVSRPPLRSRVHIIL